MGTKSLTIIVIFGITGDLSTRKLLPALGKISESNITEFMILGITRKADIDQEKLLVNVENKNNIKNRLTIFQMDIEKGSEYLRLDEKLKEMERTYGASLNRLFYLAVPPQSSYSIVRLLGTSGLSKVKDTKLLLEKPFGYDFDSAIKLIEGINLYFTDDQVYRVDHYLAKDMSQRIIEERKSAAFVDEWNSEYIDHIEIVSYESIGIEGRISFYEQTGALRDVVASHLLELAAIVLMDVKSQGDISQKRLQVLKNLNIPKSKISEYAKRGQYAGYKNEVANQVSTVETYASITLFSNDSIWDGVPIVLRSGKRLDKKVTEVRIYYKHRLGKEMLCFNYMNTINRDGYENVFINVINSNKSIFLSSEEVLESWRIIAPVQEAWKKSISDLFIYKEGSSPEDLNNK